MPEPITLAALGAVALSEGIRFLYTQTGEWMQRRAQRREDARTETVPVADSSALDKPITEVTVDYDRLAERQQEILATRARLSPHFEGLVAVDPGDRKVLADLQALRALAEIVAAQRFTLAGENREPTGTRVDITQVVEDLEGALTGIRTGGAALAPGEYTLNQNAKRMKGDVTGIDLSGPGR